MSCCQCSSHSVASVHNCLCYSRRLLQVLNCSSAWHLECRTTQRYGVSWHLVQSQSRNGADGSLVEVQHLRALGNLQGSALRDFSFRREDHYRPPNDETKEEPPHMPRTDISEPCSILLVIRWKPLKLKGSLLKPTSGFLKPY